MSGTTRRIWPGPLSAEEAYKIVLAFVKRCQDQRVPLARPHPQLYRGYWIDGAWEGGGLSLPLSTIMRFSHVYDPEHDAAKSAVARLLSVAARAHYFQPDTVTAYEPHIFRMPCLGHPGQWLYGLAYPVLVPSGSGPARQRCYVVAEWDVGATQDETFKVPLAARWPVILRTDAYTWLKKKEWERLKHEQHEAHWTHPLPRDRWRAFQDWTDRTNLPWGKILEVPIALRGEMGALGALWSQGLRAWVAPPGMDSEAVQEYLVARQALLTSSATAPSAPHAEKGVR